MPSDTSNSSLANDGATNRPPGNGAAHDMSSDGAAKGVDKSHDNVRSKDNFDTIADILAEGDNQSPSGPGTVSESAETQANSGPLDNSGEAWDFDDEPAAGDGDTTGDTPPETVAELAERLSVEPDEVYAIQVPIDDGETASIGDLKDTFRQRSEFMQEREDFQFERMRQENELLAARSELQAVYAEIAPHVPPEIVAQHVRDWQGKQQRELEAHQQSLMRMFPEWKDGARLQADRENLRDLSRKYGFRDVEFDTIRDSRMVKLLSDFNKLIRFVEDKRAAGKAARKAADAPPSRGRGKRSDPVQAAIDANDPIGAIAKLIT